MKKIILLLFFIFGSKTVSARCTMSGMTFYPEQKEISLNSMFIIQGYANSQKIINSFKERTVYLESESGELIVLNLQEILKGQMDLTQAIFCPATVLKPNTTYTLRYADQTENEEREMIRYNRENGERENVYWTTTKNKSTKSISSTINIEFEKTNVVFFGCGPSANAIFNVKNKSKSEIWYKTEFVEISTNKKTVFYITEWNGQLNVGHGMCSGAFTFKDKGKYKVRFTPMNIDGATLKTTNWTTFESPFMNR